jgi:hypothetical protein
MITWAQRARYAILQKDGDCTAKTDETIFFKLLAVSSVEVPVQLSTVSSVHPPLVFKKKQFQNPTSQDPNSWRPLAGAYHVHHVICGTCIAAGKGYGLRCGVGSSLWTRYQDH